VITLLPKFRNEVDLPTLGKVVEDNVDDVRDFHRMNDEWTEVRDGNRATTSRPPSIKSQRPKRPSGPGPNTAEELRGLVDAAKRWSRC
jgi:predicted nucleic acid-binding Zn ribbon protein